MDCNDYRRLSLTSTVNRVYGRIIRDKIEEEYQNQEEEKQCGFRSGRSCTENVFCLKQIIEKKLESNRQTYLTFVDLQKAYDNISISALWKVRTPRNFYQPYVH